MGWLDELRKWLESRQPPKPEPEPGPSTGPTFTMGPRPFGVATTVAGVEWQTQERTSGYVDFWPKGTPQTRIRVVDDSKQRDHQRTLTPMQAGTTYTVEVTATTKSGATTAPAIEITTLGGGPGPGPAPGPTPADLPHQTDFLTADGGLRTHTYPGQSPEIRARILNAMRARGYTHLYVYAYNEKDYGGPAFDMYGNPEAMRHALKEIIAAGLRPVVWLFPDDADRVHGESESALKGRLSKLVPAIDDLVSSYVLGLELDEYWSSSKVNALGSHLNGLTQKAIGTHQLPGHYNFAQMGWADYCVYQYGFGKSESQIASATRSVKGAVGKPVVAGEYEVNSEANAVKLGNAAVAAGAAGFGNGGTPYVTVPAPAPTPAPQPPPVSGTLEGANLLQNATRPWVAGRLTEISPGYAWKLESFARANPSAQLVIADMDRIPERMREAGFRGRDNALWYTLSRSYAGWNWNTKPGDPDNHLGNQRKELHDFWSNYLKAVLQVMQAVPFSRALMLLNDGHDKCGDVLAQYSLNQLSAVRSRIETGHVHTVGIPP